MKTPLIALIALPLLLAACEKQQPEVVDTTAPDPLATQLANAAPVELPPALKASVTFRCKDNSLVYVDFFQGDTQANFRTDRAAPPTGLKAEAAGEPFVAEGYSVDGDPKAVTVTQPGKAPIACRV